VNKGRKLARLRLAFASGGQDFNSLEKGRSFEFIRSSGKGTTVREGDSVGEFGASEEGAIEDALDFVRRFLRARGVSLREASPTRQEEALLHWAEDRCCLLNPSSALDRLFTGGHEHARHSLRT